MKRFDVTEKVISIKNPNFIGSWNLENDDLCNEIITWFEENKDLQKQGITSLGKISNSKKRTDIKVKPNTLDDFKFKCLKDYIKELHKCFKDYNDQWPLLKYYAKNLDIGSFNIGKYTPGGHFGTIHTERASLQTLHRVFAWMTYLNDVDDGGTTNFTHYDIKIKPEVGKTLIWPAEWTHAHSGEILNSGEKYIITGWMHFPYSKE
jgi:prolyl 4-hydroxylase